MKSLILNIGQNAALVYKSALGSALFLTLLLTESAQAQTWYNTNWLYRKAITIDYTRVGTGPHTNFPVLISITDVNLQTKALSDGDDILFTSSDGTTKLDHQIENYTSGTGKLDAWVEVPSLSSSANTVIYMYYGYAAATNQENINGTWNTNFSAVWHMNTVFTDATVNGRNGTNTGTTAVTGKIAGGRGFVRSDGADFITVTGSVGSPTNFTLSAWANITTPDVNAADIISIGDNSVLRYDVSNAKVNGVIYAGSSNWRTTTSASNYSTLLNDWHHIAFTYSDAGNLQQIYIDGVPNGSSTSFTETPNYSSGGANTFIGKHGNANTGMDCDGALDEIRIATTPQTAGWILTEYNNQNSPATFHSVGSEQALKMFTGMGNFSTPMRWTGNTLPNAGDYLIINGTCTVDNNAGTDNVEYGPLVIGTAAAQTLNWAASGTNRLNVSNVSAGSAASTLNMTNGGTLIVRGTWTSTNLTFTQGAGTLEFRSSITLPSAYTAYNNLTINGTGNTVTLSAATTTINNLTITTGTLNANNLNITQTGNWSNSGAFTAGTGRVTFSGGTTQTVTQTGTGSFYNVTISKSANNIVLNNSITISNALTLTTRFITLGNNNLTVGTGGISGATTNSFVLTTGTGNLIQNNIGSGGRTGGILFPVGTAATSYTPISINNTTGTADAYSVSVINDIYSEGTTGTLLTSDVVRKTWLVSEAVAGGSNVTLTAQWNAADEGTGFSRTSCGLSHYVGTSWDTPPFGAASGVGPYAISRNGITSFSPFGVEENTAPLPVRLLHFNGALENKRIMLTWATATEENNKGFHIEKSFDGTNFISIGFVDGNDNSKEKINYTFADTEISSRGSYYRLKQVDWDGKFEFSKVIFLAGSDKKSFAVYPNPVTNWVKIERNGEFSGESNLSLEVTSDNGHTIFQFNNINSIENLTAILNQNLGRLNEGIFLLKITSPSKTYTQKFLKQID